MAALSTTAILQGMADALPTHPQGDSGSDLASSYEVIALLIHAYLAALGFRLCGFHEDKPLSECESLAPRLPPQWNNGFGSVAFVYKHKQSAMQFVVRVDKMGTKVEIRGLAVGDENIYRFERALRDVVQSSSLPVRITLTDNGEDRSDLVDKLRKVFVSEQAITDTLHDLKVNIVQKLIPKLQQEGYVETAEAEATARSERRAQEFQNPDHPYRGQPQPNMPYPRPNPGPVPDFRPPGFEDEHQINAPPRGLVMPGRPPFNIGHDDLNPPGLGPHDPLRGSFVGGGLPRPGGFSGMHPTFDDPLFGGRGGPLGPDPDSSGYDPQAPPGARWDPVGPGGGMPPFQGGRGNPFGGNQGGNPFGGGGII
jgi:hypothetical protein